MKTIAHPIFFAAAIIFFAALPSCKKNNSAASKSVAGTWVLSGSKDSSYSYHDTVKHVITPITKWQVTINNNYWAFDSVLYRNRKAAIIPSFAVNHMPLSDSTYHGVVDTLPLTDSNAQSRSYTLMVPGITPTGKPISNAISASVFYDSEQDTVYISYSWWIDVLSSQANLITVSGKRK